MAEIFRLTCSLGLIPMSIVSCLLERVGHLVGSKHGCLFEPIAIYKRETTHSSNPDQEFFEKCNSEEFTSGATCRT
jgi:hypothetical protein